MTHPGYSDSRELDRFVGPSSSRSNSNRYIPPPSVHSLPLAPSPAATAAGLGQGIIRTPPSSAMRQLHGPLDTSVDLPDYRSQQSSPHYDHQQQQQQRLYNIDLTDERGPESRNTNASTLVNHQQHSSRRRSTSVSSSNSLKSLSAISPEDRYRNTKDTDLDQGSLKTRSNTSSHQKTTQQHTGGARRRFDLGAMTSRFANSKDLSSSSPSSVSPPPERPSPSSSADASRKRGRRFRVFKYYDPNDYELRQMGRKTQFSNERLYLHWIRFGVLQGSIAVMLLSYGIGIASYVGVATLILAMSTLIYATTLYHKRHLYLSMKRKDVKYFARTVPTLLTIGLFIIYTANFVLTLSFGDDARSPPPWAQNDDSPF
ncbi:hypothetical protein BGZ98_000313 [Dissophora globulifera]|nr:hypothetical protein BGZ98_000313 [Dissophora globulifera]